MERAKSPKRSSLDLGIGAGRWRGGTPRPIRRYLWVSTPPIPPEIPPEIIAWFAGRDWRVRRHQAEMLAAIDALGELQRVIQVDIINALSLTRTFNDSDGD